MNNVHTSCFGPLLVVGGIAGTKKQNYAYSFAMKTHLQDLLQIMDLNTVYCITNTF